MIIARSSRYCMSIINKIRAKERVKKNPPIQRIKYKPYQFHDVLNNPTQQQIQTQHQNLTPNQIYLLQTKSLQRPYTGNLWGQVSPGFYHCAVCNTRLFSFDQKINHKNKQTGHASFYDYVERRVEVIDEQVNFDLVNTFKDPFLQKAIRQHKRCQCKQCKSHLGAVFFDGPYPTFVRFSINSSMLKFVDMQDFEDPNIKKKIKLQEIQSQKVKILR